MNWDDLRFVLALAKAGSLAKAGRALKVDHTTVGRRIEALEADLGVRLFTRTTSGYVPTQEAEALMPEIHRVESAVLAVERSAEARDEELSGTVRLTASEAFGSRYLAPRLARFTERHPGLNVELFTGMHVFDLARREADVAVRFFRSEHEHLVVRRAGEIGFALYASRGYLARRRMPNGPAELDTHDLVAGDLPEPPAPESAWFQRLARGARVVFVSNSTSAALGAASSGLGITLLPRFIGDAEPELVHVPMPDEPLRGVWLTAHRDLQHTVRVRAMLDYLAEVVAADDALLRGRPVTGDPW